MSKRTVVSDYIQKKLDGIKKDNFLEQVSKESFYRQVVLINKEIKNIMDYISLIKNNKNSYEITSGRKRLKTVVKDYIKSLKNIILKYQNYIKYIILLDNYNNRSTRISDRIEKESTEVLVSNNINELLDTITSNSITSTSFNDLCDLSKYIINNYESIENQNLLFEILKELTQRFLDNNYAEDEYICLSSIKCVLTQKIKTLEKENILRKSLNNMKAYIKSVLEISKNVFESKHDYRYEIVEYFLEDEYCFSRILEEMPDIVNLTDKEGYSLVYNVMSKYLDAYFLELQGKMGNIPKEKYARLYRKIIGSNHFDKRYLNEVESLLNDFKETIKNSKFKRHKYLDVVRNLDTINEEPKNIYSETKEFDSDQIFAERKLILGSDCYYRKFDLTNEDTIVITTNGDKYHNYAYSVCKDGQGNHILKVHVTDVREFIKHNSELNSFLKHHMFFNKEYWLDEELLEKFSLEKDKMRPVITFEVKVLPSGKTENFKIYKSNIKVNDVYIVDEVHELVKKHDMRFLPYLEVNYFLNQAASKDNYGTSISKTFNKTILDLVGKFFDEHKLPYIYKGQDKQNSEIYMKNMTFLNSLFTKISDDLFQTFYKIICEDTNYARYTEGCLHHFSLNQKYYTDLLIPLYSYIGIHIQQLISEFYFQKMPNEILKIKKDIWQKENKHLIENANDIREQRRTDKHAEKRKVLKEYSHE